MFSINEFLISIGIISAISTFLAILMIIADSTIANYGDVKITVNEDTDYTVKGGRPLLSSLMEQQLFIPSACGGRGSCGLCKVKVTEGGGQYLPTELPWLSEEEMSDQVRLSCQMKVKNDIKIKVPEELFNVQEFKGTVSKITDLTHDIKEVYIKLDDPVKMNFKAGQFAQIKVPVYELTDTEVYRAYSIASNPAVKDSIELEIRLVPGGICTTYVHKFLKEGNKVTVNGPYGDFFLQDSEREVICIAGGSGMAPIKSILADMKQNGINRKTRYFFGARSKRDLFLLDEMKTFEDDLPDFTFIPALSEPEEEDKWKGDTGLITDVLNKHLTTGNNIEAYLCGSPGMIDACIRVLTENGVPEDLIFYDKFA